MLLRLLGFAVLAFGLVAGSVAVGQPEKASRRQGPGRQGPQVAKAPVARSNPTDDAKLEFFEKRIRPVLAANCYNCHSASTKAMSELRVDDRNGLLAGGGRGPAIVPGDPANSRLIQAVKHVLPKASMPPEKTLADEEIADLARWIRDGAAWPTASLPSSIGKYEEKYKHLRNEHWAFQPLRDPPVPAVKDAAWATDDIDRFVLAGLEKKGLRPVGDADRVDLIRRATFDLTGLPPTPAEIDAFVADASPAAYEKVVDRLLAPRRPTASGRGPRTGSMSPASGSRPARLAIFPIRTPGATATGSSMR